MQKRERKIVSTLNFFFVLDLLNLCTAMLFYYIFVLHVLSIYQQPLFERLVHYEWSHFWAVCNNWCHCICKKSSHFVGPNNLFVLGNSITYMMFENYRGFFAVYFKLSHLKSCLEIYHFEFGPLCYGDNTVFLLETGIIDLYEVIRLMSWYDFWW